MTTIDVEIKGLEETQRATEKIVRDLRGEPFLNGMRKATLLVQRSAKKKAPVDTGRLRASITPEVRAHGNDVWGVVGSNVKYAPFQELGTKPHFVSAANIGKWAERHGFGYTGIKVTGTPHPFLQPAIEENEQKIVNILGDTVAKIIYESEG